MTSKKQAMVVVATVAVVLGSVPISIGVASAQDNWPDNCSSEVLDVPGTYSGVFDVPTDRDAFRLKLERGDRVTVSARVADGHQRFYLWMNSGSRFLSVIDSNSEDPDVDVGFSITIGPTANGGADNWITYVANEDTFVCYVARDLASNDASFPYEWEVTFTRSSDELSELNSGNSDESQEAGRSDESQAGGSQRIAELESQIEQKNQRINNLSTQVSNLKSQVKELQTELEAADDGQQVEININVRPAENQNNFVTDGEALVEVESDSADLSNLQVRYGSGTYEIGQDGRVEVPLTDAGQHEMEFVYGDNTESVTLNVQSEDSQADGTSEEFPGFGFGVAVMAVLILGLLVRRTH